MLIYISVFQMYGIPRYARVCLHGICRLFRVRSPPYYIPFLLHIVLFKCSHGFACSTQCDGRVPMLTSVIELVDGVYPNYLPFTL